MPIFCREKDTYYSFNHFYSIVYRWLCGLVAVVTSTHCDRISTRVKRNKWNDLWVEIWSTASTTLCSRIEDPCLLLINSKKFHRVALISACLLLNNWQNFLHVFKFSVSIIKTHLYVAIYVAYLVLTCISITLAAAFVQCSTTTMQDRVKLSLIYGQAIFH